MTFKDHVLIAQALHIALNDAIASGLDGEEAVEGAAETVADALAADNQRFNRDYFYDVVEGTKYGRAS